MINLDEQNLDQNTAEQPVEVPQAPTIESVPAQPVVEESVEEILVTENSAPVSFNWKKPIILIIVIGIIGIALMFLSKTL